MNMKELANKAVDAVAQQFVAGAGRVGGAAVGQLQRVVTDRLQATPSGRPHVDRRLHVDKSGDVRDNVFGDNTRVNVKKFHIGNLHFGLGGLVSGVAVLVVALGGGTTAIVASQEKIVPVDQVVGTWRKAGGPVGNGITEDPTVLTVEVGGALTLTAGAEPVVSRAALRRESARLP